MRSILSSLFLFGALVISSVAHSQDGSQSVIPQPAAPVAQQPAAPDPLGYLPKLADDKARIFFFREAHFVGAIATARIKLNDTIVGWVENGSAVFIDWTPGKVNVSIDSRSNFGHTGFPLNLEAGHEYFVPLAAQSYDTGGGAFGYLLGSLKADVHEYCGGGWCAAVTEKDSAMPILTKLSISGPNPNASPGLF